MSRSFGKTFFQIAVPLLFLAGFFNRAVTFESLEAVKAGWVDVCLFHRLTGWLCPLCGMTRSLISFFSYNVALAFRYHPLGPVVGSGLVGLWVLSFWKALDAGRFFKAIDRRAAGIAFFILILWDLHRNGF